MDYPVSNIPATEQVDINVVATLLLVMARSLDQVTTRQLIASLDDQIAHIDRYARESGHNYGSHQSVYRVLQFLREELA